jgi:hypothetical protein
LRIILILLIGLQSFTAKVQTLGGSATYNFLKLPASPALTAVGGVNTSYVSNDVGLALNNPALLNKEVHSQLGLTFNSFFAAVKAYNLAGAYHHDKLKTSFGGGVFFIDYGNTAQTDASGNVEGEFRPKDFVLQAAVSRNYLEKWQYGFVAKFIHSDYGQYQSSGLAFDFGLLYSDTSNLFSFGVLAKNMGIQLSTYQGTKEDLPFDLQIGVTKKLAKAPLGFSLSAQQIHLWNLTYQDTVFNTENNFSSSNSALHELFNHFVFATHVYLGNHIQLLVGYNRLRRSELNLGSSGNGLNGFSGGMVARFRKLHVQYARAYFQRSYAYNQIGINLFMNQLVGEGKL